MLDSQRQFAVPLRDLIQLHEKQEEKMQIGYYEEAIPIKVAEIFVSQKEYFSVSDEISLEERLDEDFDEANAVNTKIVGKFVDYYGLAHKYHFSFQARKNQEEIGKNKILCKTDGLNLSEIIDLLKPENQDKNICIFGLATKNNEGKVDKIRIAWFSSDENFDPGQDFLIKTL